MNEKEMKEVVRHTMQVRYNEWTCGMKKHLPWTTEEASATIVRAQTQIAILTQQIEDARLALSMLTLAKEYGLKLWDLSDYLPKEQWTFVGTDDEYAEKCKELGVPPRPAPDEPPAASLVNRKVKKILRTVKKEG